MSLASAIQSLLTGDSTLTDLVPATRIFTGRAPQATVFPYVTLEWPAGANRKRTREAVYRDEMLRATVWATTYASGEPITRALVAAIDNRQCSLDDGAVLDIRQEDSFAIQDEDAVEPYWQLVHQFAILAGRVRQS